MKKARKRNGRREVKDKINKKYIVEIVCTNCLDGVNAGARGRISEAFVFGVVPHETGRARSVVVRLPVGTRHVAVAGVARLIVTIWKSVTAPDAPPSCRFALWWRFQFL